MTSRSFTIETRGQAVALFGGPKNLVKKLTSELLSRGIHTAKISNSQELSDLHKTHDPDYLVVFSGADLSGVGEELQALLNSGESRLIFIQNLATNLSIDSLHPISKKIFYSDYVGDDELDSLLISSWLSGIQSRQSLVVPGDGLFECSLLSIEDLSVLLAAAITHPSTKEETLILGNPSPISILNLAYQVRSSIPSKISLTFDPDLTPDIWSYDQETIKSNLAKLSVEASDDPETSLRFYLKSHLTPLDSPNQEVVPEAVVEPIISPPQVEVREETPAPILPPKRLTPLKASQPFFVPLQVRSQRKSLLSKFKLPSLFQRGPKPLVKTNQPLHWSSIILRGVFIALALYLGTLAFSLTIASLSAKAMYQVLRDDSVPSSNKLNEFAVTYLRANWAVVTTYTGLSKNKSISEVNLLLDLYGQALATFETASDLSQSSKDLTNYIFGSGNADVAKVVSLSRLQAEELYQKLSLLDGSLPVEPPSIIPAKYLSYYKEAHSRLATLKRSISTTRALLATAPEVIGIGSRKKYAVLFQNNMELRATGGFIGSFAILSFENGKLYDMPIYDVYDADGQLKGHVEPPKPIKDILGEASWYLRDSNFDPDFPTSARRAEWFIKKSLNQDLDGTIAVNVDTLAALLKATGPLKLDDYNETITGDNLYERAQFHAEVNFFPGSTQKKEFLSTVATSLFTKLPDLEGGVGLKIVSALATSIQEKNTLLSFVSTTTDHVFKTLGWNGEISDFPCPVTGDCYKDFAMVVDSNFGVNKSNYFIKRNIEQVITLDKELNVGHSLRVKYQNTSTSTAWPAGAYKNYQRIYLPIGTTVVSLKLGDQVLTSKDYAITQEHNKFVVAYLVEVPINSSLTVELIYSTPQLPRADESIYTWYWQKQPGTSGADPLTVYLNYPMYLSPAIVSPQAEVAPQQLKFDMKNDTDHRVTAKFTK